MSGLHLIIESPSRVRLRFVGDERLIQLVRDGNRAAFEAIYDRHAGALLSFCVYMLGSHQDAEDAVQATFASAHKALLKDDRDLALRPWLFVIARNACVSVIRKRRPWVELNGEPALDGDPVRDLEVKQEVRHLVDGLLDLPEPQRAALVLSEVQGLSQREISTVMGVRPSQVKAYAYQARANLIAERHAREADCSEIRDALVASHGAGRPGGALRRHLRSCESCREYRLGLREQSRQLGALFPVLPSLALRSRALQSALGEAVVPVAAYRGGAAVGGGAAGTAALAGGGFKAILAVVAGVACVGACGVGVSLIGAEGSSDTSPPVPPASSSASSPGAAVFSDASRISTASDSTAGSSRPRGGSATSNGSGKVGQSPAETPESSQPSPEVGAYENAGSPSGSSGQTSAPETAPTAGTHESHAETPAERQQEADVAEHAKQERQSEAETDKTEKTIRAEKRTQSHEEHVKAREQQKQAREQQAKEQEERARSLHGLPPELRKKEREKLNAERAERKAKKEKEKAEE